MSSFVHLHNHTEYSPLDGLQKADDMMAEVKAVGQNAVAATDHGTLAGILANAHAAKRHDVKFIAGLEGYMAIGSRFENNVQPIENGSFEGKKERRYHHITVLAQNADGWRNLVRLNNDAVQHVFHKAPRMDFDSLAQFSDGLILGTGCLGGPVASAINDGRIDDAHAAVERLLETVNGDKDRLFVEVMNHNVPDELKVIPELVNISRKFGLRMVATNDAHYTRAEQYRDHDMLLAIQTAAKLSDENRFRFTGDADSYFLRSYEQMRAAFDGTSVGLDALHNTNVIADMCDDDIWAAMPQAPQPGTYRLPKFPVPTDVADEFAAMSPERKSKLGCANPQQYYLYRLVMAGAIERFGEHLSDEVKTRLRHEFNVICGFGVEDYMLMVWELIAWCVARRIPTGPGRGSGAGSLMAYVLQITGVPPMAHDLLFERFLDPTRVGMPDFDLDFPEAYLDQVLAHLRDLYGEDCVARIGTNGSKLAKAAIRDVGRSIERIELSDELARMVFDKPGGGSFSIAEMLDSSVVEDSAFRERVANDPLAADLIERALPLDGISANPGIHACGIVVSDKPIVDVLPMRLADPKDAHSVWVTQWEAPDLEEVGFLKLDRLGLRNLDVVDTALRMIEEGTGERVDLRYDKIEFTGPRAEKTWAMLSEGRTTGVFQLESEGMTKLCLGVRPHTLEELSALIALYRPGPMGDGMHTRFVERKNGREGTGYEYLTNVPEEQLVISKSLDKTLGIICVARGERVYSASRRAMVPIEDLRVGELVQGVDENGEHKLAPITWHGMTGKSESVVKVSMAGGHTIRVTDNHQLYTARGWVEAKDLRVDDVVAAPKAYLRDGDVSQSSARDIAEARLAGFLLGDGGMTTRRLPRFTSSEPVLMDAFASALSQTHPGHTVSDVKGTKVTTVCVTSNTTRGGANGTTASSVKRWMRENWNLPETGCLHSRAKYVPSKWTSQPNDAALALLAALWDCDGRVKADSPNRGMSYKTISRRLCDDIVFMLLQFGIVTSVTETPYTNPSGTSEIAYHISVNNAAECATLLAPFLSHPAKKDAALALASREVATLGAQHGSLVPSSLIQSLLDDAGISRAEAGRRIGSGKGFLKGQCIGGMTIARLAEEYGGEFDRLNASRWLPVRSVVADGASDVFDITVADIHSFAVNGVVAHNCFQESIMSLAGDVAGFGPGLRNKLRKVISKKKKDDLDYMEDLFMRGAVIETVEGGFVEGLTPEGDTTAESIAFSHETAARLWRTFRASASYLFNKSHSVAYGFIAYWTAFLKANWPDYYAAALLTCTQSEKRLLTLNALRAEGITVLTPDINEGEIGTSVTAPNVVRLGLAEVRDVKGNAITLVEEREKNGPFRDLADLARRAVETRTNDDGEVETKKVSISVIEALIESGACDTLYDEPCRAGMMSVVRRVREADLPVPKVEYAVLEKAERERHRLGVIASTHPMKEIGPQVHPLLEMAFDEPVHATGLHRLAAGDRTWTVGLLTRWNERALRSGNGTLASFQIEGSVSSLGGVIFPRTLDGMKRSGTVPALGSIVAAFVEAKPRRAFGDEDEEPGGIELVGLKMVTLPVAEDADLTPPRTLPMLTRAEEADEPQPESQPVVEDQDDSEFDALWSEPDDEVETEPSPEPEPPVEVQAESVEVEVESSETTATIDVIIESGMIIDDMGWRKLAIRRGLTGFAPPSDDRAAFNRRVRDWMSTAHDGSIFDEPCGHAPSGETYVLKFSTTG